MRPSLKPALRRLRRGEDEEQLGLCPARRLVVAGLEPADRALLDLLDGSRTVEELTATGPRAAGLLQLLESAGALDDASAVREVAAALPRPERQRLAPDLAQWSVCLPTAAAPLEVLRGRRAAMVHVHGLGRVGAAVAALLAAAGVGRVAVLDERRATPGDLAPGGLDLREVGGTRAAAAAAAVQRAAPSTETGPPRLGEVPDLAVLCGASPGEHQALASGLVRAGVTHLAVRVEETRSVVGPLVLPGASPCLGCLDLERRDRDPAWPAVVAELAADDVDPRRLRPVAADVVLCSSTAALAAAQALAWLDAGLRADGTPLRRRRDGVVGDGAGGDGPLPSPLGPPAAIGATLELALPGWQWRRRSWPAHPACGCGAAPRPPGGGATAVGPTDASGTTSVPASAASGGPPPGGGGTVSR